MEGSGGEGGSGKREADVRVLEDSEELSKALVEYVVQISDAAIRERGSFCIALSGGNLAQLLWNLKSPEYLKTEYWWKWHVFWAVENFVPKTHPECYYKRTHDLFSRTLIPSSHIHSVTPGDSVESTAETYEFSIRQLVKNRTVDASPLSDCPRFDLILLMLGSDGHVGSLFPNHPVLEENESVWVAPVMDRCQSVGFTLPVINSAANIAIVATGGAVASALASALGDPLPPGSHPAQLVSPIHGNLVWFADASAASALPNTSD